MRELLNHAAQTYRPRMTVKAKRHLDAVASLHCIVCGKQPVEIHHCRSYGSKRDHFRTVPLCVECHRGQSGLHGMGKKRFEREIMSQDVMLALTNQLLEGKECRN